MPRESKKKLNGEDHESQNDVIAAYQSLINLIASEGQICYRVTSLYMQFAIVLIAGSIFPSFINSNDKMILAIVGMILSLLGITSSIVWFSMVARSRKYIHYWVLSARGLEKQLSETIRIYRLGQEFAKGNEVIVDGE